MSFVVTRLAGGLGNQMFEYAAARCVADHLDVPLYLDTSLLERRLPEMNYTARDYALNVFQIRAAPVPQAIISEIQKWEQGAGYLMIRKLWPSLAPVSFISDDAAMLHNWPPAKGPLYMRGYWQDERYFTAIRQKLCKEDFKPAQPVPNAVEDFLKQIQKGPCISVHIRRGDYVTNERANAFHGTCDPAYYKRAAEKLLQQTGVARYFLFSDDMKWVKENITLPGEATFVQLDAAIGAHWEMWLMYQCDHHIIANSSFSWWGAWLNQHPEKKVITPMKWLANQQDHIAPQEWIRC